jgi:hypothetical protein
MLSGPRGRLTQTGIDAIEQAKPQAAARRFSAPRNAI